MNYTANIKSVLIVFFLFFFLACNGEDPNGGTEGPTIDETLTKREAATEDEAVRTEYETLYKPANGVTGDPMPFYNEEDQTFYVYFLLGKFSGYPGGGVYLTKTKDFARFIPLRTPTAQILTGKQGEYDANIGTGCCVQKGSTYHFFYTGFKSPSIVTKATLTGNLSSNEWLKKPSMQLEPPAFCKSSEYRDPAIYWDDTLNKYIMIVGGQTHDGRATLVRYQSEDLNTWEEIQSLFSTMDNNVQKYEFPTDSDIPECPEIFKMGKKWYMVFSRINRDNHRKTFYRVADHPDGPWTICSDENGHHETFDGLWFYAAKTVSDGNNRYISGWASVGQDKQASINELTWGGNLITHKLVQQASGKLFPTIPNAVDAKFSKETPYKALVKEGDISSSDKSFTLKDKSQVVFNRNTSSFKIEMNIDATQTEGEFGIAFGAYENQKEAYKIIFDMSTNNNYGCPALFMKQEGKEYNFTPLIVPENKQFHVKIIVDKQVCVLYVNDNVAFSNHISNMERNPWMIFAEDDGTVQFSDITIYK